MFQLYWKVTIGYDPRWFFLAVPSQSFGPWIVGGALSHGQDSH